MQSRSKLVVYVTSHGFGHLNRLVSVLNLLPHEIPLLIRGDRALHEHWGERLRRPADFEHAVWDCGAVNPPGDSNATDPAATLARACAFQLALEPRIDEESERMRQERAALVLCDSPAFPLEAAAKAGVPAYLLSNFTWAEIYAEQARELGLPEEPWLSRLCSAYAMATAVFRAEPALPMRAVANQISAGMVLTPGRDRTDELRAHVQASPDQRVVYIYLGRYGQNDLDWPRLAEHRDLQFVGFHPPPPQVGALPNLHVVPADSWTGTDLMMSADVAIAKAGYGSTCEAMAAGTPLIYPPRTHFAEHTVLDQALRSWGGGIPLSEEQFRALDLLDALERAFATGPLSPPLPVDGAVHVARVLESAWRERVE